MIDYMNINSSSLYNNSYYDQNVMNSYYTGTNPYNYNCYNHGCCCSCCPCSPVVPTGSVPTGPKPIGSSAVFEAIRQRINNGAFYVNLIPLDIKGDGIELDHVRSSISLAPNKTYKYSVETQTELEEAEGSVSADILFGGKKISGRANAINDAQPGYNTVFKMSGEVTTENNEEIFRLIFKRTDGDLAVSSAKITITEV